MKTIKLFTLLICVLSCTVFNSCKDDKPDFSLVGNSWKGTTQTGNYVNEYTYIFLKDGTGTSIIKRVNGWQENKEVFKYVLDHDKSQLALYYPERTSQNGEIYNIAIISDEIIILSGNLGENVSPTLTLIRPKLKK